MSLSFLLFVGLFLVGLAIRATYEQLKKGRRIDDGNRPVFLVVVAGMTMLWVGWFAMCPNGDVYRDYRRCTWF